MVELYSFCFDVLIVDKSNRGFRFVRILFSRECERFRNNAPVRVFRGRKMDNDVVVMNLCSFVNGYFYHDYAFLDWDDVVIQFLEKVNDGVELRRYIGERIPANLDLP
ncbi:unnamed protein product [Heligmosomoides polygyrus]|uniref:Uncharacterized protein n=1 Tax=Heligmosomoides polygyrus TaxID=6339 RepID=A0A183FAC2_HELPZ|nr:unnamed protein product [Heligmosomoides polygyrus]